MLHVVIEILLGSPGKSGQDLFLKIIFELLKKIPRLQFMLFSPIKNKMFHFMFLYLNTDIEIFYLEHCLHLYDLI